MDFNKVFEQMFSENSDGKSVNSMNYADILGNLGNLGSGSGSNKVLLIILLLLLCCCGNSGFGNYGGHGQCNDKCFEMCCRRKKHCRKKFKNYQCYLNPCSSNNYGSSGCGFGGSWIWIIIFIVIVCGFGCKSGKGGRGCSSNVINVDAAE